MYIRESIYSLKNKPTIMKKAIFLCLCLTAVLLTSCDSFEKKLTKPQITGIPFQTEEDGKWSMLSPDGQVIFSEKLENRPHMAYDDRFFMREENDLLALYTCEAEPVKIADGFASVQHFVNGRALVAKPGGYIQMIDKNGMVLKTFDQVSGKEIEKMRMCDNGYLRFMTTDHLWGLLDADGNVLFEPVYGMLWYSEDVVLTNPAEEKIFAELSVPENMTDHILNMKGEETGKVIGSRYITTEIIEGKYLKVYKAGEDKDERKFGLFDLKGEPVIKPSKELRKIPLFRNEEFVFYDGDKYGLMNTKGEVIIKAEYDDLWFFGEKYMLAGEKDADYNMIGTIIDKQGKKVAGTEEFLMSSPIDFPRLGEKHALLKTIDEKYVLVDKEGKIVEGLPEIVDYSKWIQTDDFVMNQHVNVDAFVNKMNVSIKGIDGLNVYMKPEEIVNAKKDELRKWLFEKLQDEYSSVTNKDIYDFLDDEGITSPGSYSDDILKDKKYIEYVTEYNSVKYSMSVYFSSEGFTKKDGFVDKPIDRLGLYISNSGKKEGYMRQFYNAFAARIRPLGKVFVENEGFLCVYTKTELAQVYFNENGNGITVLVERIPAGNVLSEDKIRERAKKRIGVKEDCAVEIKD